ncbi:MAG: amidohydrolase [Acidobacteriota bacterium]
MDIDQSHVEDGFLPRPGDPRRTAATARKPRRGGDPWRRRNGQVRSRRLVACGVAALAVAVVHCAGPAPVNTTAEEAPADLILIDGKIVTVDDTQPEVEALAARDGRIVALGDSGEVRRLAGPGTEILDLGGRLAVPGFIEGHGHFMGIGDAAMILDLTHATSWRQIVEQVRVAAAGAAPGVWIRGRGWHQDKWNAPPDPAVEGFPVHDSLSRAAPANPVVLTHASGHASFVNAAALRLSGIGPRTSDPAGGEILRDSSGRATGLLRESAQGLVSQARDAGSPARREAQNRRRAELAAADCLKKGITSFQDAGESLETIDFLRRLVDEGRVPLRLWVMIREPNKVLADNLAAYRTIGYGDNHLTVRAIKVSIDGALGSRGAWLLAPYSDAPQSTGLNLVPVDEVRRTATLAREHDYQLCIHAIGDRANREVLNIYEQSFGPGGGKGLRWRIEHAQHLNPADIPRFGQLGVIASMQAIHCTSDGPWVPDRLGQRRTAEGAYVWQKLMRTGAVVTNGTDAPVEDVNPIASYHASVSRRLNDGSVFYPDQRMSRMEALRAYTINNAFAAFEEDLKGSLAVGKLADITVLSKDILTVDEEEIPTAKVDFTIVGGHVEYRRGP